MAIAIKSIPVLRDKIASAFVAKAERNFSKRSTLDFSKQAQKADNILAQAKI